MHAARSPASASIEEGSAASVSLQADSRHRLQALVVNGVWQTTWRHGKNPRALRVINRDARRGRKRRCRRPSELPCADRLAPTSYLAPDETTRPAAMTHCLPRRTTPRPILLVGTMAATATWQARRQSCGSAHACGAPPMDACMDEGIASTPLQAGPRQGLPPPGNPAFPCVWQALEDFFGPSLYKTTFARPSETKMI